MRIRFTKMQGAGNDFVMLDGVRQPFSLNRSQLRRLADRRYGVGADQILVVEPSDAPEADFRYRIFNADGGEVEQCGNGARCFVKFVRAIGLTDRDAIRVQTAGGLIEPRLEPGGEVTVAMGAPCFEPGRLPMQTAGLAARKEGETTLWQVPLGTGPVEVDAVSMGNPHAVQIVADVDAAAVAAVGAQLERHAAFPARVNAGFMQVVDRNTIRLRVWERGAGETLACGTGACAAAVSGIRRGRLDSPVTVQARGGVLRIRWDGAGRTVWMTGPAETVFEGEIDLA